MDIPVPILLRTFTAPTANRQLRLMLNRLVAGNLTLLPNPKIVESH
jgi:hypothetical protein